MKTNNPRWGAQRIVRELRKLSRIISRSTVLIIQKELEFLNGGPRQYQSWYRFLRSHGHGFFACDFLTVDTAFLRRLYVLALMDTSNSQIISIAVTKNPTAFWLETVIRNAFMEIEDYPKFMISGRGGNYGEWFGKLLSDCYGFTLCRTPPGTPNCDTYIDWCNRTVREELLDHKIIFGERDLRRLLREYVDYFNQASPHQSLEQDSPCRHHGVVGFDRSKVRR